MQLTRIEVAECPADHMAVRKLLSRWEGISYDPVMKAGFDQLAPKEEVAQTA